MDSRKSYIDKEKDYESGLGDFGVRKFDDDGGRFTSIDPLWEKYRAWSPYTYSMNNPMRIIDPSGMSGEIEINGSRATVHQHLYFYQTDNSNLSQEQLAKNVEATMQSIVSEWDGKNATISGKEYTLCLDLSYSIVSKKEAKKLSEENTSRINNFIGISSSIKPLESHAFLNQAVIGTADIANGKTPAHEYGHLLGITIHSEEWVGYSIGMQPDVFDIMVGGNLTESFPKMSEGFSLSKTKVTSTNILQVFKLNKIPSAAFGIYNLSNITIFLGQK